MGLDSQEGFAKMYKDGGVEDTVGVEVEVLDAVVLQQPLVEVAGWERESALREPGEHRDLDRVLLHGLRTPCRGSPHVHLLLPEEPTVEKGQQVFGLRRGGDTDGDVPAADPAASSRALFFRPATFAVFDGEGFILQVHGVFTRIHSGATVVASYGGALGCTLYSMAVVRTSDDSWLDLLGMAAAA
jgi:hypothetical protein